jgi:hypothetical protein
MASTAGFGAIATISFAAMGFAAAALAAAVSGMAAVFGSRSTMPSVFAVAGSFVVVAVVVSNRSTVVFKDYFGNRFILIFIIFGLGVAAPFKSNRTAGFSWLPRFPGF